MKWENFKSRFKKDAQAEEVEVDVDAIWSAIEPSVDLINQKKRKKKRFFFWIFLVGALCLGGTAYFVFPTTTNQLSKKASPIETRDKSLVESQNTTKNTTNNTNNTAPIVTPKTEFTDPSIKSSTSKNNDAKSNLTQQTQAQTKSAIKPQKPIVSKNKSQNNTSNINLNLSSSTRLKTNAASIAGTKSDITKEEYPKTKKASKATLSTVQGLTKNALPEQSKQSESAILNKLQINSIAEQMSSLRPIQTDFYSYPLAYTGANLAKITLPEKPFTSNTKVIKPSKKFRFSVGATGGISFVNRELIVKKNTNEENKILRNQYEKSLEAIHFGINLEVQHRTGLRLSLGLQQTTITDLYQLNKSEITESFTEGVQTLKVNLYGDTTEVMGEILQTTTTTINKEIYNTYRLIDLPIILGFQRSFGRWKAGMELGVLVNLSLRTKGIIPNADFQDIDIAEKQDVYFKSNIGLSYHLGLSLRRQLSNTIEVHFSPTLRYFPQDFSAETYNIKQEYMLFGANLGVNYRF
ncbi:MAG: hypothetical protein AB8G15_21940 [Saprospiraceae bacterium]